MLSGWLVAVEPVLPLGELFWVEQRWLVWQRGLLVLMLVCKELACWESQSFHAKRWLLLCNPTPWRHVRLCISDCKSWGEEFQLNCVLDLFSDDPVPVIALVTSCLEDDLHGMTAWPVDQYGPAFRAEAESWLQFGLRKVPWQRCHSAPITGISQKIQIPILSRYSKGFLTVIVNHSHSPS